MVSESEVLAVLNQVIHPSFGLSLVALEMVRDVEIKADALTVAFVMNCPGCPAGEAALTRARQQLRARAPDLPIRFTLLVEHWVPPWSL